MAPGRTPRFSLLFARMSTLLTSEALTVELGANEPWPEEVQVYIPFREGQMLLPDECHCRAVETFLTVCHIPHRVTQRHNVEFMSPTGDVPMVKVGKFMISEVDHIVGFINTKSAKSEMIPDSAQIDFEQQTQHGYFTGHQLSSALTNEERADMRAYMSLVESVLYCAELYVCWCDEDTYNQYTKPRYMSVFPTPLNHLLVYLKYREVTRYLAAHHWMEKSSREIAEEIESALTALSDRLEDAAEGHTEGPAGHSEGPAGHSECAAGHSVAVAAGAGRRAPPLYFFPHHGPTELDTLVYAHLSAILDTGVPGGMAGSVSGGGLPCDLLRSHVRSHPTLTRFLSRFRHAHLTGVRPGYESNA